MNSEFKKLIFSLIEEYNAQHPHECKCKKEKEETAQMPPQEESNVSYEEYVAMCPPGVIVKTYKDWISDKKNHDFKKDFLGNKGDLNELLDAQKYYFEAAEKAFMKSEPNANNSTTHKAKYIVTVGGEGIPVREGSKSIKVVVKETNDALVECKILLGKIEKALTKLQPKND